MNDTFLGKGVSPERQVQACLKSARNDTGLDEFGEADFLEPLEALIESAMSLDYSAQGRAGLEQSIHRCLVNRLRAEDDFRRHPEIFDEDVSDPIVVLGLARSGTTLLHRMMSADPNMLALYTWRVLNPAPFPTADRSGPDPRIEIARQSETAIRTGNPDYFAAHPTLAEDAEEDLWLHFPAFQHVFNFLFAPTKSYLDYLRTLPRINSYSYAKKMLQYLQWQDGGRRNRRWILKTPGHIGNLESLIAMHPNACFVFLHRDVTKTMPSYCRLIETYSMQSYESIDPFAIGRMAMDFWEYEMDRYLGTRRAMGQNLKILDISYRRILEQPLDVVEMLYRRAGVPFTAEGRNSILQWSADNPQNKHGKNTYKLERYGLSADTVRATFATGSE